MKECMIISFSIILSLLYFSACIEYECHPSCIIGQCQKPNDPFSCYQCASLSLTETLGNLSNSFFKKANNLQLQINFEFINDIFPYAEQFFSNIIPFIAPFADMIDGIIGIVLSTLNEGTLEGILNKYNISIPLNTEMTLLQLGFEETLAKEYGMCIPIQTCISPLVLERKEDGTSFCHMQINFLAFNLSQKEILIYFYQPINIVYNLAENYSCIGFLETFDNKTLWNVLIPFLSCIPLSDHLMLIAINNPELSFEKPEINNNNSNYPPEYQNSSTQNFSNYFDLTFAKGSMTSDGKKSNQETSQNETNTNYNSSISFANISQMFRLKDIIVNASLFFSLGCKNLTIGIFENNTIETQPFQISFTISNYTDLWEKNQIFKQFILIIENITQFLFDIGIPIPPKYLNITELLISEFEFNFTIPFVIPGIAFNNHTNIIGVNLGLTIIKVNTIDDCGLCRFIDHNKCENLKGICFPNNYLDFKLPSDDKTGLAEFYLKSPVCLKKIGSYCLQRYIERSAEIKPWNECDYFFLTSDYHSFIDGNIILDNNKLISFFEMSDAVNPILGVKLNVPIDLIGSNRCSDYIKYLNTTDNSEILDIPNDKCLIKKKNFYNEDIKRRDSILYLIFDPSIKLTFNAIIFKKNMIIDNIFMMPLNRLPQINLTIVSDLELEFPFDLNTKLANCMPLKGNLKNFVNSIYHNIEYYVLNPHKEATLEMINAQLKYFNNQNSFLIPSEMTSSLTSLEIHVKYNILNRNEVKDKSITIYFDNSIFPVIIPKILYQDIYLYSDIIEDFIEFYLISNCIQSANFTTITEFTIQISSTNSNGITNYFPELVSNYTISLKKYKKIIFDPSKLVVGNNYTILIQPLDNNSQPYDGASSIIKIYVMNSKPGVEIICPPIVSNQIGILNITSQIYPYSYYEDNKDSINYNWICFDLDFASPNHSISISNLYLRSVDYYYSCSVQVIKSNQIILFSSFEFFLIKDNYDKLSQIIPVIENFDQEILISLPINQSDNLTSNVTWELVEVRNETLTYGSFQSKIYESFDKNYFDIRSPILKIKKENNLQQKESLNIPENLNILNQSTIFPYDLLIKKNSQFSGYSFKLIYKIYQSSNKYTIGALTLSIPKYLVNAVIAPTKKVYNTGEKVDFKITNPNLVKTIDNIRYLSIEKIDCPDSEDSISLSIIPTVIQFDEIILKIPIGFNKCNYLSRLILTQIMNFSIIKNFVDIYIVPIGYDINNPTNNPTTIDIEESESLINDLSNNLDKMEDDPEQQMKEIFYLERNIFSNLNATLLEGNAIAISEFPKINHLLYLINNLITKVMDNIKSKKGRILLLETQSNIAKTDKAINIGFLLINDMITKSNIFINNTCKILLVKQLFDMGTNIISPNNVPSILTLTDTINSLLYPCKDPNSNYKNLTMNLEDFNYMKNVIVNLMGLYAIKSSTNIQNSLNEKLNLKYSIKRETILSFSDQSISLSVLSNSKQFNVTLPSNNELFKNFINKINFQKGEIPIANYIINLINETSLSNDLDSKINLEIESKDSIYMNKSLEFNFVKNAILQQFANADERSQYLMTPKLNINFMISKVKGISEVSTDSWLGICDSQGKVFHITLIDETGEKGIKIPVFISPSGIISNSGMKIVNYNSLTKELVIEWNIPECSKSRILTESTNTFTVFAYINPEFNNPTSKFIDKLIKLIPLWIAISILGVGIILFFAFIILNSFIRKGYIVKACSLDKRTNSLINKAAPLGVCQNVRNTRIFHIFGFNFENQQSAKEEISPPKFINTSSIFPVNDQPSNMIIKEGEIVSDPYDFENNKGVLLKAISICDIERETRSSSLFIYLLDEHILTCIFSGTNLRYTGYLKVFDLISSILSLIFLTGLFFNFSNLNLFLSGLCSSLCNIPLSIISKKLFVGNQINFQMKFDEADKASSINKTMAGLGFILSFLRCIGGIIGILILCIYINDSLNISDWVYGFIFSLGFDLIVIELIKIIFQIILILLSTYKMENGKINCIKNLLSI